jgi:hypothetical protein
VTPTLWGAVVIGALIVLLISAWLVTRDTTGTPPKPPGRHRRPHRDPHDPIRDDDQPPPGGDPDDSDTPSWGDFR